MPAARAAAFVAAGGPAPRRRVAVLAENRVAVRTFCRLATQWRRHAFSGRPVGLIYEGLAGTLRLMGIPRAALSDVFERLQVMEEAALAAWGEG